MASVCGHSQSNSLLPSPFPSLSSCPLLSLNLSTTCRHACHPKQAENHNNNKARVTRSKCIPLHLKPCRRARAHGHTRATEYRTDDKSSLSANEPFPPVTRLARTSNRKIKKKEAGERKRWGGFKVAPAPPSVYIFGCVCRDVLAKAFFFLSFFSFFFSVLFKSLITGSGRLAWPAAAPPPSSSTVSEINLACLGSIENSSTNSGYTAS